MREPSLPELAEDIFEIKERMKDISHQIAGLPYVRNDLFEAKWSALQHQIVTTLGNLDSKIESTKALAMWALGAVTTVSIAALIALITIVRGG